MTNITEVWLARARPRRSIGLTAHERIVLMATQRFKPSYAGNDRYQMARAEALEDRSWITDHIPGERYITRAEWSVAKQSLIDKRLLTMIGGITTAGRDALGDEE